MITLRIVQVDTFPLLYRNSKPYGDANGLKAYRSTYFIRLVTESGITGWGECSGWLPALECAFREQIIPYILGQDARLRTKIVQTIGSWHTRPASAVSMALTDIAARRAGQSVCGLWGGPLREQVPVYASFQSYTEDETWESVSLQRIEEALTKGFTRMKVKVGGKPLADDMRHIRALQSRFGRHIELALDANQSYDAAAACAWQPLIGKWDNWMWFEEPLPLHQWQPYAHCRQKLGIPISGGENVAEAKIFMNAVQQQAFDILQPDPVHVGDLDEYRGILQLARFAEIRVSPHTYDGALARCYALYAQACLKPWSKMEPDSIEPVEWDMMDNPFTSIVPLEAEQGMVRIPSGTGVGLDVDEELMRHYRWDGSRYW